MLKAIELLIAGFRLLPTIIQAILFAESIYGTDPSRGGEKLALIRETLEDLYETDEDKNGLPDYSRLWAFLERRIERIIKRWNENGWPPLPETDVKI